MTKQQKMATERGAFEALEKKYGTRLVRRVIRFRFQYQPWEPDSRGYEELCELMRDGKIHNTNQKERAVEKQSTAPSD